MSYWHNFKKLSDWISEIWNKPECSKLCKKCKRTWKQIRDEDGEGYVHLIPNVDFGRLSCDSPHAYLCDKDWPEYAAKNEINE